MSEIVNNSVSGDTKKSTDASSNEQDDAPTFVQDKTTKNQDSLWSRQSLGNHPRLPSIEESNDSKQQSREKISDQSDTSRPSALTSLLSGTKVEPLTSSNTYSGSAESTRPASRNKDEGKTPEELRNESFGCFRFRPKFLQRFNSPVAMLVFICLLVAVQAKLVSGFLNTSLSTIEKVFGLSSTESGLIISTYDAASLVAVIPVTYFGQAGRKPRYLGGGALLIAAGCFVFFLPEAFRDPYTWLTDDELQYCSDDPKNQECADHNSNHNLKFIFMAGTLLIGVGATPVYTLGVAYMDENVPKAKSALYLGIFYTIAVVAPALGYVLSGLFLRIPIDFKHWSVAIEDPGWAGAWFIGFLLQALLALLIAIPLLGLPKSIKASATTSTTTATPSTGADEIERVDETAVRPGDEKAKKTSSVGFRDIKQALKSLPKSLMSLVKNVTFMLLIMHGVCAYLVISGLATFLPKYFESQFGLSSSDSAFMVGSLAIPAAAIGTLGSGIFLKHKDWPCIKVMKFGLCVQMLAIPFLSFFLFSCPRYNLAGLNADYNNSTSDAISGRSSNEVSFDSACNSGCSCDYVYFDPVCGSNDLTYFSPCHAGCYGEELDDCKCLGRNSDGERTVGERMICEEDCATRELSYALFFLMLMIASMVSVPHITCLLRVVPDTQRSLALGLQWVFVRLLGTIPGPIIVGKIFDSTCLLWNESKACHESSFCLSNDTKKLGYYTFAYAVSPMIVGLLFLISAIKTYKTVRECDTDSNTSEALKTSEPEQKSSNNLVENNLTKAQEAAQNSS
ncbi:solute carrier organic anion transporter family member 4A1-like isoform X2 [Convolutriloba macropyga]|uniref:solute carrier organic anion transporter family member 4A1-like isoform X2 n=1 Tax=Convolutriloba macropyga TaxID=536237 RepID=UPI003F522298